MDPGEVVSHYRFDEDEEDSFGILETENDRIILYRENRGIDLGDTGESTAEALNYYIRSVSRAEETDRVVNFLEGYENVDGSENGLNRQ